MNLMIFGAGFSGLAIARHLAPVCLEMSGTTRSAARFDDLRRAGLHPLIYAGGEPGPDLLGRLSAATHLVASISPDQGGDPLLGLFAAGLKALAPDLCWVGYLSTVGVYGDHGGEWVDEDSECRPVSRRSVARLAAERGWARLCARDQVTLATLRLSGIYGPGRNALCNIDRGTARRLVKPGQVFNRIHVADIGAAAAMLAERQLGGIYNITDDEPAPPQDVVAYAAGLAGVAPPPETDFATADLSPMARSFYGENKRVANSRIKALGYSFSFPDYRAGLSALWEGNGWRG
ncbi:nucleoside-diphosphate-sugar epimerase [Hoeflea marina]|uniref:Nucleoside-diphosphate-sugar epimerase n=1 Tax=Hoeflea marina TaxID=274592 RepID=A0A317PKU0_9HYPH|nr:SDR family oxidoreductase [Hoeflea marina]PWW00466.1 nucleoside-diphosphate-sugar epimerase [Hoeflea marina]